MSAVSEAMNQMMGSTATSISTMFKKKVDIAHYLESAAKHIKMERPQIPELIKGIRGTSSAEHSIEHLSKGILRAKYNLHVNKDGTIRYDATELPITHFKPKEISVSIKKLIEMGYTHDTYGKELLDEDQILEQMILNNIPTEE